MKRKPKILLVEDEQEMSAILKLVLSNQGYEPIASIDGKNIFPFYADPTFSPQNQHHFDLVLMDKQLNGKNGLDICKLIKSDPFTKSLPVIIISASPRSEEELTACGADDFVEKPFDLNTLLQLIRHHLQDRPGRS